MLDEADDSFVGTQERFRIMAEGLPQLVWTALPGGQHDWFNKRCQQYTGLSASELKLSWKSCIHPDDLDRARQAWRRAVETGDAYEVQYRVKGSDGIFRRFLVRALPMTGVQGQIVRWFGTCTDLSTVSATDRDPEQARQTQKLEAMGQITGSVIHDFNNLLTAVLGNLELISMRTSDDTVLRFAGNATEAVRRGVTLTGQLLAFTRAQNFEIAAVDLNDLIDGMDDLLRRSLGPEITLALKLDPDIPPALCNGNQVELAVLNLAINARDAMSNKGSLTISTRLEIADQSPDARHSRLVITVTDTGTGIPPELITRVFEPFFTTKAPGKGTGLGLAQVRSIAHQCGGGVTIDSTVGIGTSINMFLPAAAGYSLAVHENPVDLPPVRGAGEIVLVIDDDADVRRYLIDSLSSLGYIVFEAPDGASGLKIMDNLCPDLLIVDHGMPGVSGQQVIDEASVKCPKMPVILTSGYRHSAPTLLSQASVTRLPKPFHLGELSHAVRASITSVPLSDDGVSNVA